MFDKTLLLQQLHEQLQDDLQLAERALQASHEAATHEQSKAENKYDTRGLEAAYLANGQQQRCLEIRQALQQLHNLQLRPVDQQGRVQLTSLVALPLASSWSAPWMRCSGCSGTSSEPNRVPPGCTRPRSLRPRCAWEQG